MKHTNCRKIAWGGVVLLGMSVGAVAQNASGTMQGTPQGAPQQAPQMTMDQRMARLTQALNLTTAQQAQIRPVLEQAQAQMQALAADTATPMADRQAKAQTIRENLRNQIEAVLTPEQKQRAQAMAQRGPGGQGTQPAQPQTPPQPHQ